MSGIQLPIVGDRFLGRWQIEEEIGEGGFSVVYRAVHDDGRIAAVKALLPQNPDGTAADGYDQEIAERFLREARLLEHLDSPYTIRMWEFGESPAGLYYMIFEFIDGRSLHEEIRDHGPIDPDRVVHILRQTLIGLQSAHALGILHRDIKPPNIMLHEFEDDPDRVKLVDFGIAKMFGEQAATPGMDLTAAGLLVGTPRYMSPEQLKSGTLGPPSDLYAVGLCALEMLTARKCIPGNDRMKILQAQISPESFTVPADLELDPTLRDIIDRLLKKNLHERFSSAAQALRALEAFAGDPGATGDTVYATVKEADLRPIGLEDTDAADGAQEEEDDETVFETINSAVLQAAVDASMSGEHPLGALEPETATGDLDLMALGKASTLAVPAVGDGPPPETAEALSLAARLASDLRANLPSTDEQPDTVNLQRPNVALPPRTQSGKVQKRELAGQGPADSQFSSPRHTPVPQPPTTGSGTYGAPDTSGDDSPFESGSSLQPGGYQPGEWDSPTLGAAMESGGLEVDYEALNSTRSGRVQPPQPQQQQQPPPNFQQGHAGGPQHGLRTGQPGPDPTRHGRQPMMADEKLSLGASVFLPGLGHVLLDQMAKGMILVIASIAGIAVLGIKFGIAAFFLWLILAVVATVDMYLVIHARRRRPLKPLEFFPDFRQML